MCRGLQKAQHDWSSTTAAYIDIYRNGVLIATIANTGEYLNNSRAGQAEGVFRIEEDGCVYRMRFPCPLGERMVEGRRPDAVFAIMRGGLRLS
jgi:hypothetical protein